MKRRKFINFSALGLAGTAVGSSIISGFLSSCSNSDRQISVALVGCTDEAIELLSDVFSATDKITLKEIFDFNIRKQENAVQLFTQSLGYSPEQNSDLKSLFGNKEYEAVFVFLPAGQIPDVAMQIIKAGKDLYIGSVPIFGINEPVWS
jgi:NADH/NAD ratio-sensing transcriptional regulator Rex